MEPYKAKMLPMSYKLDKETIKLLGQANDKYGQYKSLLKMFKFDQKYFLDSLVLGESIRSSRIEGTLISQDDMYYINYKESNDSIQEVRNLKTMLEYANEKLSNKDFSISMINSMHKILLSGVRGNDKSPGEIRTIRNYIGPRGLGKEGATFVPPIPEDVPLLLENLMEYMNNLYDDEPFIKVAINECRNGNVDGFIRFFLQCVVDQCTRNIGRIEKINRVYDEDEKTIKDAISGSLVLKMHPLMM